MKKLLLIYLLAIPVFLTGCGKDDGYREYLSEGRDMQITVASVKSMVGTPLERFIVETPYSNEVHPWWVATIDGFTEYEEGYEYVLDVHQPPYIIGIRKNGQTFEPEYYGYELVLKRVVSKTEKESENIPETF